jgi:hypothetical protein
MLTGSVSSAPQQQQMPVSCPDTRAAAAGSAAISASLALISSGQSRTGKKRPACILPKYGAS